MGYRKENKFAFDEARKENFIQRLKEVIGGRSIRAAAKDWGLSFSTLNNYITRGTEPSFIAMQAIAHAEGISLDWLAFGISNPNMNQVIQSASAQAIESVGVANNEFANELLRRAHSEDKEKLINAICDIGIKGILNKLQQSDEGVTGQAEREYTNKELEAMIMALPVRESLKTAFARGVTAGEAADREILRILESHERGVSPGSVPDATETPDPSLKQKAG